MESLLMCSLCYSKYDHSARVPRFLSCGHTFCTECLSSILSHEDPTCPEDSSSIQTNDATALPPNKTLLNMLGEPSLKCPTHNKPLELVCMEERIKICSHCALVGKHKDHPIKEISEVNSEVQVRVRCILDMMDLIDKTESEINSGILQQLDMAEIAYKKKRISLEEQVKQEFDKLRKQITKLEKAALEGLHNNFEYIEQCLLQVQEIPKQIYENSRVWKEMAKDILGQIDAKSEDPEYIPFELLSNDKLFQGGEKLLMDFEMSRDLNLNSIDQCINELDVKFEPVSHICKVSQLPFAAPKDNNREGLEFDEKAYQKEITRNGNFANFAKVGNLRGKEQEIAEVLRHHNSVRTIKFCNNNLAEDGIVAILQALRNLHSLEILNLSFNALGENVVSELSLLLKNSNSIKKLVFLGNPFMNEGLRQKLVEAASNSVELII